MGTRELYGVSPEEFVIQFGGEDTREKVYVIAGKYKRGEEYRGHYIATCHEVLRHRWQLNITQHL
jgi:hypothetical protein